VRRRPCGSPPAQVLALSAFLAVGAGVAHAQRPSEQTRKEGPAPAIVTRAPLDTAQAVNFRVLVQPETLYVGQQATYQLGVFLDESVRDRLRRMEALAPEMRSMMAYEPPAPLSGFPMRAAAHHRYEAHVYQRPIFPLAAGRFAIPPARLVYALPLSYSFFSREESYELRSDSAVLVAIDPPAAGRPTDYAGAVGVLQVTARFDTTPARVGDPITLTVSVSGQGNVKLFPRPALDVSWASMVRADERVRLSTDSLVIAGDKEFDWVLTPRSAGRLELPAIRYPFFDPYARRYETASTNPLALLVAPGVLTALDTSAASTRPRWAVRATSRGEIPQPIYREPLLLLALLAVPVPALALLASGRPRRQRRATSRRAALAILAKKSINEPRTVRRAYLGALAERLHVPAVEIAEPSALARIARRSGVSTPTAAAAAKLLGDLGVAAFSAERRPLADAATRAHAMLRDVDREARRLRRASAPTVAIAILLGAVAVARAAEPHDDAAQFARGVEAYAQGQFAAAAHEFAAVTVRSPRAADAWANLGTAAFAAGDTARAILGWQRALRLEPLASDARARLDFIQPLTASAPGNVLPIPPEYPAVAAIFLWVVGWIALALRSRRRDSSIGPALTALGVAVLLGGATVVLDRLLDPSNLAVVRADSPLRIIPALAAERTGLGRTAEVARVVERAGLWQRVSFGDDRDGWVESSALLPLDTD